MIEMFNKTPQYELSAEVGQTPNIPVMLRKDPSKNLSVDLSQTTTIVKMLHKIYQ